MEVLGYFFYKKRLLLYVVLAFVLSLPFFLFTGLKQTVGIFYLIFLELWLMRLTDDRTDYEKDGKLGRRQPTKEMLGLLIILFASVYTASNIILFGMMGFLSFVILSLILVKESSALIPPMLGPASGLYYLINLVPLELMSWREGLFLVVILVLALGYGIKKRKSR